MSKVSKKGKAGIIICILAVALLITGYSVYTEAQGERLRAMELEKEGKTEAYVLEVGNFKGALSSLEDIKWILEGAIGRYDPEGLFAVEISEENIKTKGETSPSIVKKDGTANMMKYVSMFGEGVGTGFYTVNGLPSGLVGIDFEQKVVIKKTVVSLEAVLNREDVLSDITKDKEKNQTYVVEAGDCLGIVAEKQDMKLDRLLELNNFDNEGEILHVGDELIVSVPEPDLSVITNTVTTVEEVYDAEVQYVDNDNWYTTQTKVLEEGASGRRIATRSNVCKNGRESSGSLIAAVVLEEAKAEVVEKGTQEPPTYVKPINGGRFSSGFEMRWGRMHKGVDWACPTGTPVFASCRGTVARAEFSSSYGYVVYINHPDGRQTRYAHNSKLVCKAGDVVKQGEIIAYSGSTGNSTGPHVHFEILIGGSQVNPLKYLN